MEQLTCIDLFSGCGGLSLGMLRAGFTVVAAIDSNAEAIQVLEKNLPDVRHPLQRDLTKFSPQALADMLNTRDVDVIVGGPPCQGFSTARQRDGANSGPRMIEDKRRHLYKEFLRYVDFFKPKLFVMENVLGIKSAAHGRYFTRVQEDARSIGYRVHPQVEKALELGVPQKRVRQLIVGTRLDLRSYFFIKLERLSRASESPTLDEAIGDLPPLKAGSGTYAADYDKKRRRLHVGKHGRRYLYGVLEVRRATKLTGHVARPHNERDLRDFAKLREGENSGQATKRGVAFEFPYDKENFTDRYTRQHRDEACSTIVAHMSKDGLMFIHPTQNRSLTAREAARVQSFPDWFEFPVPRTHQFRLIGNAVPPLVGEALGLALKAYLQKVEDDGQLAHPFSDLVPRDLHDAAQRLVVLVNAADSHSLHRISIDEFRRGWFAIGFLYPEIHPYSALEHGTRTSRDPIRSWIALRNVDRRLVTPHYVQSGWPVALAPVATDAWRRYKAAELTDDEFYCTEALIAAIDATAKN